jgi:hypothetical protein
LFCREYFLRIVFIIKEEKIRSFQQGRIEVFAITDRLFKLKIALLILLIALIFVCISLILLSGNRSRYYEYGVYVYHNQIEVSYAEAI